MEIEQSFSVPFALDRVWSCFQDTEGVVACLPGASLSAPPVDGNLKLGMSVKLGPIVATFSGDGRMELDDTTHTGRVTGGGSDRKSGSRVKGEAEFSLRDEGAAEAPATRVDVKVNYTITGSLAQFSRAGIVKELATRLTEAFADNLRLRLESLTMESDPPDASPSLEPAADTGLAMSSPPDVNARSNAVTSPAAPLDLGQLFWPMVWQRIKGLFGLGRKEPAGQK